MSRIVKVKTKNYEKLIFIDGTIFCTFTAFAQTSGKYQANSDIPSLNISKGDIVYISFSNDGGNLKKTISFENMSNLTSFIAQSAGGMGGLRKGYYFAYYNIEGVGIRQINYQINYNESEVIIGNYSFTKIVD